MGRFGPGVGFCLGAVLAVGVGRALDAERPISLLVAVPFASLHIVLRSLPECRRSWAGRSLWIPATAGVVVGLLALPAAPRLGVARVRTFRGVAVEDSTARTGGGMIHRLSLLSAGDGQTLARSTGTVRLLDGGESPLWAGDVAEVAAGLAALGPWEREDFVARSSRGQVSLVRRAGGALGLRARARAALETRIRQMGYPMSGFFLAMFLGDRAGVEAELVELYKTSGCLHVLALSGSHLVLVYGLALLLTRPLPWPVARRLGPLGVVVLYVALAGPLPSLLRALAMLAVAWLARSLDREVGGIDILALALSLLIVADPAMLFDLSLTLSVGAVAGMIVVGGALQDRFARYLPPQAGLPLFAGVGAQILVAPMILAATGWFQPVGLVSGLVVAPLSTAILVGGLVDIAIPLAWLPDLHAAIGWTLDRAYELLLACLRFFGAAPAWRSWWAVGGLWACVALLLVARPASRWLRA